MASPADRFRPVREVEPGRHAVAAPRRPDLRSRPGAIARGTRTGAGAAGASAGPGAVEFERVVPASGNLAVAGKQFWLGPARAGITVTSDRRSSRVKRGSHATSRAVSGPNSSSLHPSSWPRCAATCCSSPRSSQPAVSRSLRTMSAKSSHRPSPSLKESSVDPTTVVLHARRDADIRGVLWTKR
jgi:hypothetical protein